MLKKLFISLLLITINLLATDLDSKIEALQKAPKNQRYKIMNEIKMELIKLNQDQRDYFLQKLLKHKKGITALSGYNKEKIKKNREHQSVGKHRYKENHSKNHNGNSKQGNGNKHK